MQMAVQPDVRWWIIRVTQPLSCLAFAGGIWLAWLRFPASFDWRYQVISELQSPRDNPDGYHWYAFGLAVSALLMMPLVTHIYRTLRAVAPGAARTVQGFLGAGVAGMLLIAAFTHPPAGFPKLHDTLAVLTLCSLILGLLTTALLFARHERAMIHIARRRPWVPALLALTLFCPSLAAGSSQLLVTPTGAGEEFPRWLSIAFWEWILCALIYASSWLLAWMSAPFPGVTTAASSAPPRLV